MLVPSEQNEGTRIWIPTVSRYRSSRTDTWNFTTGPSLAPGVNQQTCWHVLCLVKKMKSVKWDTRKKKKKKNGSDTGSDLKKHVLKMYERNRVTSRAHHVPLIQQYEATLERCVPLKLPLKGWGRLASLSKLVHWRIRACEASKLNIFSQD